MKKLYLQHLSRFRISNADSWFIAASVIQEAKAITPMLALQESDYSTNRFVGLEAYEVKAWKLLRTEIANEIAIKFSAIFNAFALGYKQSN